MPVAVFLLFVLPVPTVSAAPPEAGNPSDIEAALAEAGALTPIGRSGEALPLRALTRQARRSAPFSRAGLCEPACRGRAPVERRTHRAQGVRPASGGRILTNRLDFRAGIRLAVDDNPDPDACLDDAPTSRDGPAGHVAAHRRMDGDAGAATARLARPRLGASAGEALAQWRRMGRRRRDAAFTLGPSARR
jgi:hypothetical protein